MLTGLYSEQLVEATRAFRGKNVLCPFCSSEGKEAILTPVCGNKVTHHWRHKISTQCDTWAEKRMTKWHYDWQLNFPIENREIVITRDVQKHRADIVFNDNHGNTFIIEIQHSPISITDIEKRESFYGNMMWILDFTENLKNFGYINHINNMNDKRVLCDEASVIKDESLSFLFKDQNYCLLTNLYILSPHLIKNNFKSSTKPVFLDTGDNYLLYIIDNSNFALALRVLKDDLINHFQNFSVYKQSLIPSFYGKYDCINYKYSPTFCTFRLLNEEEKLYLEKLEYERRLQETKIVNDKRLNELGTISYKAFKNLPKDEIQRLNTIWNEVLANIQQPSKRALLHQLCHLVEFDGNVAKIVVKKAWYEKLKSDYFSISNSFKNVFFSDIEIYLETF